MKAAALLLASAFGVARSGVAVAQAAPGIEKVQPAAAVQIPTDVTAQAPARSALPSRDTIAAAVRDTIAEQPAIPHLHDVDTLRANAYETFARKMDEATTPDCLHADGLKRQPTFFLNGYLALPFIVVAKLRGVCK
jgi:hypothetical protein